MGKRGLYLESLVKEYVHYDIQKKLSVIEKRIGKIRIGVPIYLMLQQYSDYILRKRMEDYYRSKSRALDEIVREQKASGEYKKEIALDKKRRLLPNIKVKSKFFDTIFGGSTIELILQDRIDLDLGTMYQKTEDPHLCRAALF